MDKKTKNLKVKKSVTGNAGDLRNRAEKLLKRGETIRESMEIADMKAVLHELQVHQIELELQNQELQQAQVEAEEARNKYFDLYELAPVAYLTLDKKGEIIEINLT